jgi:RNA polymerase sigma-70 factor, ECF subfamily
MNNQILIDYVERIYLFARGRTYSPEEAEELAQEVLFEACKSLNGLRDASLFEPWLFGLANNVLRVFRRKKGREHYLYAYDTDLFSELAVFDSEPDDEIYADLRRRLAYLSSQYRQILIMHYYDGLSCAEIAKKLGIAEGTVKWRLSEGRTHIKKEWNDMNETALRPKKLIIRISGVGNYNGEDQPFPWQYISDAVSQNILRYAYEEAKSIEELSILTGIPAYYIEDAVANLIARDALIKKGANKYQTDFIIHTGIINKHINAVGYRVAKKISDRFWDAIDACIGDILHIDFYSAGKSEAELKWLIAALAVKNCTELLNPVNKKDYEYRVKYDGYTWAYHANEAEAEELLKGISVNASLNQGSEGTYSHIVYEYNMDGGSENLFSRRKIMNAGEINLCELLLKGITCPPDKKEIATQLLKDGILVWKNDETSVNIPAFTIEQIRKFKDIVQNALSPIADEYRNCVLELTDQFTALFPKHVENDARRFSAWMYMWLCGFIAEHGFRSGRLKSPPENSTCDVLLQWREPPNGKQI